MKMLTQKDSSAGQTEKQLNILLQVSTVVIGILVLGSELSAAPAVLTTGLTTARSHTPQTADYSRQRPLRLVLMNTSLS